MEETVIPIFAIAFTFGAPALILWQLIDTRHRERTMVIEKGLDAAAYAELFNRKRVTDPSKALKWGLLFCFVGGGLWLGSWMEQVYKFPETTPFALMLIGGGLALAIYYLISRSPRPENKK
jgi:hypothetical protein